ncbi:MAG: HlyD family type I secretion periplasmic adaptor subunit [Hyphomonadaceae bacterium]|nr:HlyD family type I secretion periplasmic adaptor subunit [Hyphomonadaceae bacterium]
MKAMGLIFSDRRLSTSFLVCAVSLGGFLAWAGLAPLAEGVTAYGSVVVESDRKLVQHLEGGIIDQILIKEGDMVETGDPLMVLTDIAASAGRDQVTQDLVNHLASIDRLTALLAGNSEIAFTELSDDVEIRPEDYDEILARQRDLFAQQNRRLSADVRVLRSRAEGLAESARNQQAQIESQKRSVGIIEADLVKKESLLAENLVSGDAVVQLQRDLTLAESELFRLNAAQEQNLIEAREVRNQIIQTEERFAEDLTQELLEARASAAEAGEQLRAAQDVVNRTTLFAPRSGEVLNLKYSTLGGVVQPGEAVVEIVPREAQLVASLEIFPADRDGVYEGLRVMTRLSGFDSWRSPSMEGKIMDVSPDLKSAPSGDYSYYEARVVLDVDTLAENGIQAAPGMPVEAFVLSGQKRTLLNYLVEPITATFRRGAKE